MSEEISEQFSFSVSSEKEPWLKDALENTSLKTRNSIFGFAEKVLRRGLEERIETHFYLSKAEKKLKIMFRANLLRPSFDFKFSLDLGKDGSSLNPFMSNLEMSAINRKSALRMFSEKMRWGMNDSDLEDVAEEQILKDFVEVAEESKKYWETMWFRDYSLYKKLRRLSADEHIAFLKKKGPPNAIDQWRRDAADLYYENVEAYSGKAWW